MEYRFKGALLIICMVFVFPYVLPLINFITANLIFVNNLFNILIYRNFNEGVFSCFTLKYSNKINDLYILNVLHLRRKTKNLPRIWKSSGRVSSIASRVLLGERLAMEYEKFH